MSAFTPPVCTSLEPLLRKIRPNPNIIGVPVGSVKHKLSEYVDDVLFHVLDPLVSLPNLMEELSAYSKVSTFRIKYAKSKILPGTIPPALAINPEGNFSLCLVTPFYAIFGHPTY